MKTALLEHPRGLWSFRSPAGRFWIKSMTDGHYALGIDDETLRLYDSPIAAADDVACCSTGCYEWDKRAVTDWPISLCEWRFEKF